MSARALLTVCVIAITIAFAAACGNSGSAGGEKTIKTTTVNSLNVSLASSSGELRNGENDLLLSFTDQSGTPMQIEAASLSFHMPAMGSMPEMNSGANLTTTDTPGKFRAKANLEMGGTWEARIMFQGPKGSGQTAMTVNAK